MICLYKPPLLLTGVRGAAERGFCLYRPEQSASRFAVLQGKTLVLKEKLAATTPDPTVPTERLGRRIQKALVSLNECPGRAREWVDRLPGPRK